MSLYSKKKTEREEKKFQQRIFASQTNCFICHAPSFTFVLPFVRLMLFIMLVVVIIMVDGDAVCVFSLVNARVAYRILVFVLENDINKPKRTAKTVFVNYDCGLYFYCLYGCMDVFFFHSFKCLSWLYRLCIWW